MAELAMPVILDGSYGEGSGALVRTALAMSALTARPVRIENVRGASRFPGIAPEDLALVRALQKITQAEVVGAKPGGVQLSFLPTKPSRGADLEIDIPEDMSGPGHQSAAVLLTALAPVIARGGRYTSLTALGETFGHNTLSYDAFAHQTLPALRAMGIHAHCDLVRAGFGLRSVGEIHLEIEPSAVTGALWKERGQLRSALACITLGDLPEPIAKRGESHLLRLAHSAGIPLEIEVSLPKTDSPGAHIAVLGEYEQGFGSGAAMGSRGVRIESVAQMAFEKFLAFHRSPDAVDEFLADQILIPAAIAEGPSAFRVHRLTQRFLTQIWVIKQFIPFPIVVKGKEGESGLVTIRR